MKTTAYQDIIRQPVLLQEMDVAVLKDWVQQYPHVPLFRVMLAAKGMQQELPEAGKWLEKAAIYVQDRRQLKRILQHWTSIITASPVIQVEEEPLPINSSEAFSDIPEEVEELADEHAEIFIPVLNASTEDEKLIIISSEQHSQKVEEAIIPEEEFVESTDIPTIDEADTILDVNEIEAATLTVESEITEVPDLEHSNHESDTVEIVEEKVPTEIESTTEEGITDADDQAFLRSINKWESPTTLTDLIQTSDWQLEQPGNGFHTLKSNDIIDQGLVQTDITWLAPWLHEFNFTFTPSGKTTIQESVPELPAQSLIKSEVQDVESEKETLTKETVEQEVKKDLTEELTSTHSFEEWLTILSKKQKEGNDGPVFDLPQPDVVKSLEITPENVVSKPIQMDNPSSEDFKESDMKRMAEDSVLLKSDLASETLAKIYVQQGKVAHAIQIYKKMMQRYPEKSSYFAAQIHQLKAE